MSIVTKISEALPENGAGASAIRMPAMANRDYRLNQQATVRKHTKNVKRMRVLLPVLGGLMALSIIGFTILDGLGISLPDGVIFSGDGLVMTNPRLAGHSEKGRGYLLEAQEARQPLDDTKMIHLVKVKAFTEMSDDDEANMTAESGIYNSDKEFLTLKNNIVVVTKSGYTIRSEAAEVDLEAGTLDANSEVTIVSEQLDLRSDSARVTDQGKVIKFKGNVRIIWERKQMPAEEVTQ